MKQPKGTAAAAVTRVWLIQFDYPNSLMQSLITGSKTRKVRFTFEAIIRTQEEAQRKARTEVEARKYDPEKCLNIEIQLYC